MTSLASITARATAVVLSLALLSSCGEGGGGGGGSGGGGGGSGSTLRMTFSASTMTFAADTSFAAAPAPQTLRATLTGTGTGTLYIVIEHSNPELVSLSPVTTSGTSGEVTLIPVSPSTLGVGSCTGSLVVRACMNDPTCNTGQIAGSPHTLTFHYDVADIVDGDTVTPRVVQAAMPGSVVLRGHGFAAGTTVQFGGVNATQTTVISNTEIRADYPPLAAGNHPIALNSGAIAFTGALTTVAPESFAAHFIPHAIDPTFITSMAYDPVRRTLFLVELGTGSEPTRIGRYEYAGGNWATPLHVVLPGATKLLMSHDNSRLLVMAIGFPVQTTTIVELDPVTLAMLDSTTMSFGHVFGTSLARANDGNLIIATRPPGSGSVEPVIFGTRSRQFRLINMYLSAEIVLASRDGGDIFFYGSSTGRFSTRTNLMTNANPIMTGFYWHAAGSVSTRGPERHQSGTGVYDDQLQMLGIAPGDQVAAVIRPDGSRLYTLDRLGPMRTYDLDVPAVGGGIFPHLVEIGSGTVLAGIPGGESTPPPQMATTLDGDTVFIAGTGGIAIQPVP